MQGVIKFDESRKRYIELAIESEHVDSEGRRSGMIGSQSTTEGGEFDRKRCKEA